MDYIPSIRDISVIFCITVGQLMQQRNTFALPAAYAYVTIGKKGRISL